jgi:hypothetical protein
MSVYILYDQFKHKSVMFCSTDGIAFGPVFDNQDAIDFSEWMIEQDLDPRDVEPIRLLMYVETWKASLEEES